MKIRLCEIFQVEKKTLGKKKKGCQVLGVTVLITAVHTGDLQMCKIKKSVYTGYPGTHNVQYVPCKKIKAG